MPAKSTLSGRDLDGQLHPFLGLLLPPPAQPLAGQPVALPELAAELVEEDLVRRRGEDAEVDGRRGKREGDEGEGGDDAEQGHSLAEGEDESDVEEEKLVVLCGGFCDFLKHYYIICMKLRLFRIKAEIVSVSPAKLLMHYLLRSNCILTMMMNWWIKLDIFGGSATGQELA